MTDFGQEQHHAAEREFDRRLDAALSAAPAVSIPDDFAARVMQSLPARKLPVRAALPRIPVGPSLGYRISLAALSVLLIGMVGVGTALGARHEVAKLLLESLLAGEFALLTVGVVLRPRAQR